MNYKFGDTLPKLVRKSAIQWPEISAQLSRTKSGEYKETNYHDLFENAMDFAGALLDIGVKIESDSLLTTAKNGSRQTSDFFQSEQ